MKKHSAARLQELYLRQIEEVGRGRAEMSAVYKRLRYWPVFRDRDGVLWWPKPRTMTSVDPRTVLYDPLFKIEADGLAYAFSDQPGSWATSGYTSTLATRLSIDHGPLTELSPEQVDEFKAQVVDQLFRLRLSGLAVQWDEPDPSLPHAVVVDDEEYAGEVWRRDIGSNTYSLFAQPQHGLDGHELVPVYATSPLMAAGRPLDPFDHQKVAYRPLSEIRYSRVLATLTDFEDYMARH